LKITRKYSAKKKSSPWDFIFDTCASTSSSHFFVGEADHMRVYPFAGTSDKCIFSKENTFFAIWARVDTNFLNLSRCGLIKNYQKLGIGLVMRHFPCGANL